MVRLLVTTMVQTTAPTGAPVAPPAEGAAVLPDRLKRDDYVALYSEIGSPFQWDARLRMSPEALDHHLESPGTPVYLLEAGGITCGMLEAVDHADNSIEVANFGIVDRAYGKGLGRFLLDAALRGLWEKNPARIWLRTDTNDHPAAQGTYVRAGFVVESRDWRDFPD